MKCVLKNPASKHETLIDDDYEAYFYIMKLNYLLYKANHDRYALDAYKVEDWKADLSDCIK